MALTNWVCQGRQSDDARGIETGPGWTQFAEVAFFILNLKKIYILFFKYVI